MRVYLARFEVYEEKYGDFCELYGDSYVFLDFEKAYQYVKADIEGWIERCGYNDENSEKDREYLEGWFDILERDTGDEGVWVLWEYNLDGELQNRVFENGHEFLPGDELPEAGTKFEEFSFVKIKGGRQQDDELYLALRPRDKVDFAGKKYAHWENFYYLIHLDKRGYWSHRHVHESHLEPYTGEVPIGYQVLRKIYMGEAKISLKRLKEIFEELADDSEDTTEALKLLLQTGRLALPSEPTYRDYARENNIVL